MPYSQAHKRLKTITELYTHKASDIRPFPNATLMMAVEHLTETFLFEQSLTYLNA